MLQISTFDAFNEISNSYSMEIMGKYKEKPQNEELDWIPLGIPKM